MKWKNYCCHSEVSGAAQSVLMEQRRSIMMPAALTGSGRPPVPELSVLPLNSLPVISSLPPFTAHNGANVAAALSARSPTDCSSSISAPAARHTHIRRRK